MIADQAHGKVPGWERTRARTAFRGPHQVGDDHAIRMQAVAWVAWNADPKWIRKREAIAYEWISQRCLDEQRRGVIRVSDHPADWLRDRGAVSLFARQATIVTNRSRAGTAGPTLVPDAHDPRVISGGMRSAGGSSLVLVENPFLPLAGWAMQLGAVDLATGQPTPDTRTVEQVDALALMVDQGYNGWRSAPGGWSARHHMTRLAEMGMSWWVCFGSILGMDPHRTDLEAVKKLAPLQWQVAMTEHRKRTIDALYA